MTTLPAVSPSIACAGLPLCPAAQGVTSVIGRAVGAGGREVTTQAAEAVFHALLGALLSGATSALGHMLTALFDSGTSVPLTSDWFVDQLGSMARVTGLVVIPLLLAATIGAVVRQDPGRLVRTWLVWLPLAGILTLTMIPLVSAAVTASQAMTDIATKGAYPQAKGALSTIAPAAATLGGGVLAAIIGGLLLFAAVVIWLEMALRSAAILITAYFLPLILAGLVWPATAHLLRRALEVLVALILSQFVVASTLCLGLAALSEDHPHLVGRATQPDVIGGAAILLLAAFAPVALLRLVPVVEAAAIGHLEGRARQPLRAAGETVARGQRHSELARRALGLGPGPSTSGDEDGAVGGGAGWSATGGGPGLLAGEDVAEAASGAATAGGTTAATPGTTAATAGTTAATAGTTAATAGTAAATAGTAAAAATAAGTMAAGTMAAAGGGAAGGAADHRSGADPPTATPTPPTATPTPPPGEEPGAPTGAPAPSWASIPPAPPAPEDLG